MAPRTRKTTRTKASQKETSPVPDDLEERKEYLRVVLEDFDRQVEARINKIRQGAQICMKEIEHRHEIEMNKLPQRIRNMNFNEYLEMLKKQQESGEEDIVDDETLAKDIDERINEKLGQARVQALTRSQSLKSTKRARVPRNLPPPSGRILRSTRKRHASAQGDQQQATEVPENSAEVEQQGLKQAPNLLRLKFNVKNTPLNAIRNLKSDDDIVYSIRGSPIFAHRRGMAAGDRMAGHETSVRKRIASNRK